MNDTAPKTCLTDGSAPSPGWDEIKSDGQQVDYLVLCPEERAKGFIRPVRRTYVHVGLKPKFPLRDLTPGEIERWGSSYSKYEEYPEGYSGVAAGRLWKKADLEFSCGGVTTMSQSIAETYARDPKFYGSTYCVKCGTHFPVAQFVWVDTDDVVGS